MNAFQILIVIFTALGLFGGIITVYVKTQIDIAKINVTLTFFQKDLDRKEVAILNLEHTNKIDHDKISLKIDKLILELKSKQNVKE
jgi:hypothetical protein